MSNKNSYDCFTFQDYSIYLVIQRVIALNADHSPFVKCLEVALSEFGDKSVEDSRTLHRREIIDCPRCRPIQHLECASPSHYCNLLNIQQIVKHGNKNHIQAKIK